MPRIFISEHFKRQIKWYLKKLPKLHSDVIDNLTIFHPDSAVALGGGLYKIRMRSSDLPKGKSHAFRMIILFVVINDLVTPITIYSKGDKANMQRKEIRYHVDAIRAEIDLPSIH